MSKNEDVMNTDRQFCEDCKTGKEEAWASYFLDDGVMVTSGTRSNIVGKEAIKEAMKPLFSSEKLLFEWEPDDCEVADDGSIAVTRGTSKIEYVKDGKEVKENGNYTTIWKNVNGKWKIVWDIGN